LENILCVDVEDWYHPEYVKKFSGSKEIRVTQNVDAAIQLLDKCDVKATFFVVGEIAEACPEILDKIVKSGNEVAFHGYYHDTLWGLSPEVFRVEIKKYNSLVKSITGCECLGFRAPSYSLDNRTKWAIDVLEEEGFAYDSSIFPIRTPLYGEPRAPIMPYNPSSKNITKQDTSRKFMEFPALVYPIAGLKIPAAGGFYLRLLPLFILKRAIKRMNKQGFPAVFSFHTWEIDPNTPRLKLGIYKSFVTYHNLPHTSEKLINLISAFRFTSFKHYLEKNNLL
jgi:polysaccharide deacetylase family protein (PEP-CTERM system associated)